MNTGRGGGAYCAPILDVIRQQSLDVIALQEVDLNASSSLRFVQFWKQQGFHACVGAEQEGLCRTALLSRLPLQAFALGLHANRCTGAVLEIYRDSRFYKVALVSFYGFPNDSPSPGALLEATLQEIAPSGLDFIILGDFQFQTSEQPVSPLLAAGLASDLDDCRMTPPVPTGPGRTRVIDYALSSRGLHADTASTFEAVADHLGVWYDMPFMDSGDVTVARSWPAQVHFTPEDIRFDTPSFETQFASSDGVENMWKVLSSFAEQALTDIDAAAATRHLPWQPRVHARVMHKACTSLEPLALRRARRLQRRLQHLVLRGGDPFLMRRIRRDLRELTPHFPPFAELDRCHLHPQDALACVRQCVDAETRGLQDARIASWKGKMQASVPQQRTWIKNRAELHLARSLPQPSVQAVVDRPVHPSSVLQTEYVKWQRLWTSSPALPALASRVEELLERVPLASPAACDFDLTPDALQRSMQVMRQKGAGPNGLLASQLLLMPPVWWNAFAKLWGVILATSQIPESWRYSRIALVAKHTGGFRPIGLTDVCWRCGARLIIRGIRSWATSWMTPGDCGGLPSRSTADAHRIVAAAIRSGSKAFIQEDLQKYYDTIHFPLAALVLERLGMPVQVVALLRSFYSRQFRLLSFRGQCSSQWIMATRGLVQGCPISPVIAAAIMHIWQLMVSSARVSSLAYQDDRTLILKPDVSQTRGAALDLQPLADACQRSRAFDAAFDFSCDSTKSAVIGDDRCQGLADSLGYPREENLSLLGVCHPLNPRAPRRLLHFTVDKLKARMKFIPAAVVHPRLVILHLRSLCYSQFTWAAGFARPSADELASVASDVKASFGKNLTFETPPCLLHEACGWLTEPCFCADWALLQQAHRLHCSPPSWLELLPLSEACAPWFRVLPLATKVLQRLGWTVSENGGVIYRRDNALRLREYRMGFDSLQVLKEWLLLHYRRSYLSRCGRVVKSLHRQGPNLAQGADLPAPAAGAFIRAAGHVAIWSKNPPVPLKRAALATGGSVWHFGPHFGPWAVRQPPQCLCGLNEPSRVHLTFHCPATRELRDGLLAPGTRIQERLFAMEGEEIPPAPATPDVSALVAEWCTALPVLTGSIVAATDGGAKDLVAASGIFLPQLNFIKACAVPGEDQSNYKAEIFALWLLLSLLVSARRRRLVAIHVLVDCEAAILAVEGQGNELPCLIRCIRSHRRCLQQDGTDFHLHWVPSHGKRPRRWRPWSDLAPAIQQQYNDIIDAAVTECLAQRLQGSLRSSFLRRAEAAQRWEERVIAVSAAAGQRFADSISA